MNINWLSVSNWVLITAGGSILFGKISSAIWEWLRDSISITYSSTRYINFRGHWDVSSSIEHENGSIINYRENLNISQQFGRRFRGKIYSPHPTNQGSTIELKVRGEFKDKFHVVFFYEHCTSSLTDVGAGTIQINADHTTAEGATVNFGVSSPKKPTIIRFKMIKAR